MEEEWEEWAAWAAEVCSKSKQCFTSRLIPLAGAKSIAFKYRGVLSFSMYLSTQAVSALCISMVKAGFISCKIHVYMIILAWK